MATKKTALTLAIGSAIAASIAGVPASAAENPFATQSLTKGYMVAEAAEAKCGANKAGEAKCGAKKTTEGKCGEGKCGGAKAKEGKCGEGKCGGKK